MTQPW